MGRNQADISTGGQANFQTQSGKNASNQVFENNDTMGSLNNLNFSIQQAQQLLPKVAMTGPVLGRVGNAAEDPDYKNLQGAINSITLQAKDLYNLGSGQGFTDADREFLRDVVAGKYARAETIEAGLARFQQALQNRQAFLQQQNAAYQSGNYNPQIQTPQQPTNKFPIRVSDGKNTFLAEDENDLKEAQQQGYSVV